MAHETRMINPGKVPESLHFCLLWIWKQRVRFIIYPIMSVIVGMLGFLLLVAAFHLNLKPNGTYDAAVVFFGGFDQLNQPNTESKKRLSQALYFCSTGMSQHLMIVGGHRKRLTVSGAEVLAQEAIWEGYPKGNIQVGTTSYDTVTNVREVKQLAKEKGWKKLLLISSPLHVMRISWLFENHKNLNVNFASEELTSYCSRSGLLVSCLYEWIGYFSVVILPDHYRNSLVVRWRG